MRKSSEPVKYAVVGLGYFAQIAVLPGFKNLARSKTVRLEALVSDDPVKRKSLSRKYGVKKTFDYAEYDACLRQVDAVYIALPNDLHREYAVRALEQGVHVLCEKPMAVTEEECQAMIRAGKKGRARLMVAYRLHLNTANLKAVDLIRRGKIGKPRLFNSLFSQQVSADNIRIKPERGGGTLYDIGVYCINAARYLFGAEPVEATAFAASSSDPRFRAVDEMTSAILRFPGDRLAAFSVSFGAAAESEYQVAGTEGVLVMKGAYGYAKGQTLSISKNGKVAKETFGKTDQMGAELEYFSECILKGKDPEPSGLEGLADVRIVRALLESVRTGKPVKIKPVAKKKRPTRAQAKSLPPVKKPRLVKAKPATRH